MRWQVARDGTWIELGNGTEIFVGDGHSARRLVQSHNEGLEELEVEIRKHKRADYVEPEPRCILDQDECPDVVADMCMICRAAALAYPTSTEFVECATCRAKPGSPILCDDCLRRRDGVRA